MRIGKKCVKLWNIRAVLLFLVWTLAVCPALCLCPAQASIIQEASVSGLAVYDVSVSGVGYHSAVVRWKTNIPATSQVFYDTWFHYYVENYGYHTTEDETPVLEHRERLDGLMEDTVYHFRVVSVSGSREAVSGDFTFRTLDYDSGSGSGGTAPQDNPYLTIEVNGDASDWPIALNGHLLAAVDVTSLGDDIAIHIPDGTCCLNPDKEYLHKMRACLDSEIVDNCRACARNDGYIFLGKVYDIGPTGSTFEPYARLILAYEDDEIPAGITEDDLCLAWCHGDEWVLLDSVVDAALNTVSAQISHLSVFAIVARPSVRPREFVLSNLDISPVEVNSGEPVTVSVAVMNTGGSEGTFPVNLWVGERREATRDAVLSPGETETVVFTIARAEPGVYSVVVAGLNGSFTVREVAVPSPEAGGAAPPRNDWLWLVIGLIACFIIIFAVRRRKKSRGISGN